MIYHWNVYTVFLKGNLRGYVFAQNEQEAAAAWNAPADYYEIMDEAEFYMTSDAEGGHVIFLAPDELVDHLVEAEQVNTAHVLWVNE